jgi:chemotaxis methyl-accepting protein methylase/pimeloyl-ACP methyl ester carboxylesterase/tetratricopeptide (TPR) repeat protein
LAISLLFSGGEIRAERYFRGTETAVAVRPTNRNYYISTLTGESEHYAPTFYDDHLRTIDDKDVGQFTLLAGEPVDFYWYPTDPQDLAVVSELLHKHQAELDKVSSKILPAFVRYRSTVPAYLKKGLYVQTMATIKDITAVAPQKVMGDGHLPQDVDAALFQYLRSNGVSELSQLKGKPALVSMLVNKFYTLSTTHFYRDYPYVKAFLPYLGPIRERLAKENRPFKANVFACSTGEEVITYAIELMEAGIKDFTILASDINEPGLRHAAEFRYSYNAFERLPLATQQKVKKYFRLNEKLGLWEPIDMDFFKSRIKYMRQDLLKDLPSDLDPRFAPPYDLVSIMNVLFYLEDAAVQSRKDGWARLLAPDGILVLHDFYYSVMSGTLGREWSFQNFLAVNEWVSVKAPRSMSAEDKAAFARQIYEKEPTDVSFLAYVQAEALAGRGDKSASLCEEYLKKRPRSVPVLSALWELETHGGDAARAAQALDRLVRLQPQTTDTLGRLAEREGNRRDKDFLIALRRSQETFLAGVKSRSREMETVFDFREPVSEKYEPLRTLVKAYAFGVLENSYLGRKMSADGERIGREGLRILEQALAQTPDYPCLTQFLDHLLRDLLDYDVESGLPDKALELTDQVSQSFAPLLKGGPSFYDRALPGHLFLSRATALRALGRDADARAAADQAAAFFDKAGERMEELMPSWRPFFYGDIGRAHMIRAELMAKAGDDGADEEEGRALSFFEQGLSYNPLYGKSMSRWRDELLRRRQAVKSRVVPLEGTILRFRDDYGPYDFTSEVIHYKSEDGADVEATLLSPGDNAPKRPGLVFVHMWARDRATWWGLPEFLASHGYPCVSMDLRGHGGSRFPGMPTLRVTIQDSVEKTLRYKDFYRDVVPAVDRLLQLRSVKDGKFILFGASLGCPVGVQAADKRRDKLEGLVMLSPSLAYFGVDCHDALKRLDKTPLFVMAEKTDESFKGAKEFFGEAEGLKTYLQVDHLGHGTDALYRDAGLPTLLLQWLEQTDGAVRSLDQINRSHPLQVLKKK